VRWAYNELFSRIFAAAARLGSGGDVATGALASGARHAFRDLARGDDRPTDPEQHARNVNEIAKLALVADETLTDEQALELYNAATHLPEIKSTGLNTSIDNLTSDEFTDALSDMTAERLQEIAVTVPSFALQAGVRRARALARLSGREFSGYPDVVMAVQPLAALAQMKHLYELNMDGDRISLEQFYEVMYRGEIDPDTITVQP
jgi:hypothetical protein